MRHENPIEGEEDRTKLSHYRLSRKDRRARIANEKQSKIRLIRPLLLLGGLIELCGAIRLIFWLEWKADEWGANWRIDGRIVEAINPNCRESSQATLNFDFHLGNLESRLSISNLISSLIYQQHNVATVYSSHYKQIYSKKWE